MYIATRMHNTIACITHHDLVRVCDMPDQQFCYTSHNCEKSTVISDEPVEL